MVTYPAERRTFCKREGKHTVHKASLYKKGKDSLLAQGKRRYDRKQRGFGGQTKPIFRRKAKTTKKQVIRLTCSSCKCQTFQVLKRCHRLEISRLGATKKSKSSVVF